MPPLKEETSSNHEAITFDLKRRIQEAMTFVGELKVAEEKLQESISAIQGLIAENPGLKDEFEDDLSLLRDELKDVRNKMGAETSLANEDTQSPASTAEPEEKPEPASTSTTADQVPPPPVEPQFMVEKLVPDDASQEESPNTDEAQKKAETPEERSSRERQEAQEVYDKYESEISDAKKAGKTFGQLINANGRPKFAFAKYTADLNRMIGLIGGVADKQKRSQQIGPDGKKLGSELTQDEEKTYALYKRMHDVHAYLTKKLNILNSSKKDPSLSDFSVDGEASQAEDATKRDDDFEQQQHLKELEEEFERLATGRDVTLENVLNVLTSTSLGGRGDFKKAYPQTAEQQISAIGSLHKKIKNQGPVDQTTRTSTLNMIEHPTLKTAVEAATRRSEQRYRELEGKVNEAFLAGIVTSKNYDHLIEVLSKEYLQTRDAAGRDIPIGVPKPEEYEKLRADFVTKAELALIGLQALANEKHLIGKNLGELQSLFKTKIEEQHSGGSKLLQSVEVKALCEVVSEKARELTIRRESREFVEKNSFTNFDDFRQKLDPNRPAVVTEWNTKAWRALGKLASEADDAIAAKVNAGTVNSLQQPPSDLSFAGELNEWAKFPDANYAVFKAKAKELFEQYKLDKYQQMVEKRKSEFAELKAYLPSKVREAVETRISRLFAESNLVVAALGQRTEAVKNQILERIQTQASALLSEEFFDQMKMGDISKALSFLKKHEATFTNMNAHMSFDFRIDSGPDYVVNVLNKIGTAIHSVGEPIREIESYRRQGSFTPYPPLVQNFYDFGPMRAETFEKRAESYKAKLLPVLVERLRLRQNPDNETDRNARIAQTLGLPNSAFIENPGEENEKYLFGQGEAGEPGALKRAQDYLINGLGFSEEEVKAVSENLYPPRTESQQSLESLVKTADLFLFNQAGEVSFAEQAGVGEYLVSGGQEKIDQADRIDDNGYVHRWSTKEPAEKRRRAEIWLEKATINIDLNPKQAVQGQERTFADRIKAHDAVSTLLSFNIEVDLAELLTPEQRTALLQELEQDRTPQDFYKRVAEVVKNSDAFKEKLETMNKFVDKTVKELVANPNIVQEMSYDPNVLTSADWMQIVFNIAKGRFASDTTSITGKGPSVFFGGRSSALATLKSAESLKAAFDYGRNQA